MPCPPLAIWRFFTRWTGVNEAIFSLVKWFAAVWMETAVSLKVWPSSTDHYFLCYLILLHFFVYGITSAMLHLSCNLYWWRSFRFPLRRCCRRVLLLPVWSSIVPPSPLLVPAWLSLVPSTQPLSFVLSSNAVCGLFRYCCWYCCYDHFRNSGRTE